MQGTTAKSLSGICQILKVEVQIFYRPPLVALKLIPRFPSKYSNGATDDLLFLNIIDGQFYSPFVFLKVSSLKYINIESTRMHSSRMRTARGSSRLLGVSASVHSGIRPRVWAWRPPWVWAWRPPWVWLLKILPCPKLRLRAVIKKQ